MIQAPQLIHADALRHWSVEARVEVDGRPRWTLSRPLSCGGLLTRIRLAWKVFTGECDALKWGDK